MTQWKQTDDKADRYKYKKETASTYFTLKKLYPDIPAVWIYEEMKEIEKKMP